MAIANEKFNVKANDLVIVIAMDMFNIMIYALVMVNSITNY